MTVDIPAGSRDVLTEGLFGTFLADDQFWPSEPRHMKDTGLTEPFVEALVCKYLAVSGTASGRTIADYVCLPHCVLESVIGSLRARQLIVATGAAPINDYCYALTEPGRQRAEAWNNTCRYVGPAPVPLMDYVISVEAQTLGVEPPAPEALTAACNDISVDQKLLDAVGPAVSSGGGMLLYGAPGNGKSTLAKRITHCFGHAMWVPSAVIEDNQVIKLFDASYHKAMPDKEGSIIRAGDLDRRWVRIRRPTVIVGGELTMDSLELRYDPISNVSEAPLQMKSNGGCLLIDDFGRQRIAPAELLNRWIVPLESRHDYLSLPTGKKIQVPFEQLIIFSTNLEPKQLVDEAFLRRIPYKVHVRDPDEEEFHRLFELHARQIGFEYRREVVEYLLERHYRPVERPRRRCQPRDLLYQIRNFCQYRRCRLEMCPDYVDRAVQSYFATV